MNLTMQIELMSLWVNQCNNITNGKKLQMHAELYLSILPYLVACFESKTSTMMNHKQKSTPCLRSMVSHKQIVDMRERNQ